MRRKLYVARLLKGYTLEDMAKKLECGRSTYRRIEQGGDTTISRGLKICEVLDADFVEIFLPEVVHRMNKKGGEQCG